MVTGMMKMDGNGDVGDDEEGTVVVGVKMDGRSRELLTWALVKVAQPGDHVIALHVLTHTEIVDCDGKSSLLSLVKAFDSILAVYQGFCNLKQVDLKLKICRGPSIPKILVREATSYMATKVIVGTARNHHKIRSSYSVAKYLAKKISKDCLVLAVNNGKILFQRETTPTTTLNHRKNGILRVIHRSVSKNSETKHEDISDVITSNKSTRQKMELACVNALADDNLASVPTQNCSTCEPKHKSAEEFLDNGCGDNTLAIIPVQTVDGSSSSISSLMKELPELKPGWPLLRRSIFLNQQTTDNSSVQKVSAVQWAMRLPKRNPSLEHKHENQFSNLDALSGAIVPVGVDVMSSPLSPDRNLKVLPKELEGLHEKYSSTCRLFKYYELVSATSNFIPENLIGKGGSSQVYRGCLSDGKEVAVKTLKSSEDAIREFLLEIEIITTLNHRNIISLLGFCFEDNNLLLVYDFLSRGSLEENLYGYKKEPIAFGWNERYKVALGIAEALDYLHRISDQPVIHRDVKSSNILLSVDFEPQLSDFGLAKWASITSSHITCTDVAGTFGYLAPEYFMYGKVNEKIDVYAYGVVLLELLSGRKAISSDYPKGQQSLVMWAKPILTGGKVSELLDLSLGNNFDDDQMERMVLAATLCIRRAPRARPTMALISKLLQGDPDVSKWANLQVNVVEESDMIDEETCPLTDLKSHLSLALLDVEDDSLSLSSVEQSISIEDYLQGRWSRSSSFD